LPSYDSQGYGGGILTCLLARIINLQENENVNTENDKWFIMENAWVNNYISSRHSKMIIMTIIIKLYSAESFLFAQLIKNLYVH
jgi:hypothetical protein